MADIYEQNLPQKTNLTTNDYVRVVGSDDVSYKQPLSDVAQKTIENYAGSTLAGSTQSVKGAIDGLKSSATADKAELNASINEVASDLASESSTRASQDTNLQEQINQFVAPTGTAPNPTEITNARVGADNVTYTTLGDAIRTQVTDLKSDFTDFNNISKPTINPLLCIVNYGTNANYGKYELEIYKDGGTFGFAYFNEPHDVLFDAYINGDEGVKFILTKITPQVFEFVSVRSNDAGYVYSFDRATNDIGIVAQNPCLDNIQNGDRIIIHFEGTTMYVCNRTKNTVNYVQTDVTAFGFVASGNQGIVSYAFYGVDDIYYMISDLVSRGVQKKCYCFGDSITWYDGKIPDTDWTIMKTGTIPIKGYISYLSDLLGMNVSNYGISGETSIQICNRIKNTAFTNIDYCTITAGTNDFLQNLSIGTLQPIGNVQDTESSFYGAIQSAIEYIIGSNSNTRIVLISPIRAWKNVKTTPIAMTDVYAEALKNIAELYGLPFVDFYNNIGINELNKASFSIDDISNANVDYYLHPNNYYQMKMGYWLVNTMRGC